MKVFILYKRDMTPYSDIPDYRIGTYISRELAELEKEKFEKQYKKDNSHFDICTECPINNENDLEKICKYCKEKLAKEPKIEFIEKHKCYECQDQVYYVDPIEYYIEEVDVIE